MSNVEKLMEKLKETGYRIGGLTVGTNPNVTAEEVAEKCCQPWKKLNLVTLKNSY